ncbi:5-formyltetrahydrofolate cyclo-ligase [Rhodococcoides trifolii]|uniref:5-formyltetrahydrofolate cyclo-ligase n=1 Tax=Rhodococcoides trifolii TaxID=908250 RepID=A0A917G0Y8_9NOCA|nr:5-formyltetrahydrofolate cyclo-ligase [Rhodococcus trifolii]GGG17231.1 5-formyltetrahydrofolate cyclo-ligase [Rhodococcus trifolii]
MAPAGKAQWRRRILDARRHRSLDLRAADASALSHVLSELASGASTVAAYVPVGSEPGSIAMLDAMRGAGARVLLPLAGEPGPLQWAFYSGPESLVPAPYGLREPSGSVLPPEAVADAEIVLVPALAIDRRGVRLGRGAGFYDRTLSLVSASADLVGVVYDDEYVDLLPGEQHDIAMTHVVTPGLGLRRAGAE